MKNKQEQLSSLDHSPPVVLQAGLQLLQDPAALLQLRGVPVRERHVVHAEASLLVGIQQGGNSVPVELCPAAEYKDLLHPLVLELLWWEKQSRFSSRVSEKADVEITFGLGSSYQRLSPDSCGRLCICTLS